MSKNDKKKHKLLAHIALLETEMSQSLGKKTSATVEIDVPGHLRKIADLKAKVALLG